MVLIDTLNNIGNAIRQKTGKTDLIPLVDMPKEILSISGGGTVEPETAPNPLEYAIKINEIYREVTFPTDYELVINTPFLTSLYYTFYGTKGIKKVTIKGNANRNVIDFTMGFRNSADLETVDFTELVAKVDNGNSTFHTCRKLREIKGEIDFTECTSANTMFQNCVALEKVKPKANSIKISIGFPNSEQIDFSSIQAIFDGLTRLETAQTLTLNANQNVLQSQIDSANAKGWTVVGGKVVQEAW